ncbi:hypothetical protein NP493_63g01000 [Ridgeia piscesae]|uniref:Uncharacterized protein n=1 Tax=Ridgeia piscesae TaxID=27915 RepID=A0AAD9PA11_RIDPI|nr:hypothetical protein NP493_63g01000 [Ridgeia piscesae]
MLIRPDVAATSTAVARKALGPGMQGPTGYSSFSIESLIAPSQPRVQPPLFNGGLLAVQGTAVEGFIPPHIACSLAGAGLRLSPEMSIFPRPIASALPVHTTQGILGQNYAQLVNVSSAGLLSLSPSGQLVSGCLRPWDMSTSDRHLSAVGCLAGKVKTSSDSASAKTSQPQEPSGMFVLKQLVNATRHVVVKYRDEYI